MASAIEDVTEEDVPIRKHRAQELIAKPINTPYTKRRTEILGRQTTLKLPPFVQ